MSDRSCTRRKIVAGGVCTERKERTCCLEGSFMNIGEIVERSGFYPKITCSRENIGMILATEVIMVVVLIIMICDNRIKRLFE